MEILTLPVTYKGEELEFPLRIVQQGYVYRFVVLIAEQEITYEQDNEGQLRALQTHAGVLSSAQPDAALISTIGSVIAGLLE